MSMKISSDTLGNRTRDLPTCSAVPHHLCSTFVISGYERDFCHPLVSSFHMITLSRLGDLSHRQINIVLCEIVFLKYFSMDYFPLELMYVLFIINCKLLLCI